MAVGRTCEAGATLVSLNLSCCNNVFLSGTQQGQSSLTVAASVSTYELHYEVNVCYSTATYRLNESRRKLFGLFIFIYGLTNRAVAYAV